MFEIRCGATPLLTAATAVRRCCMIFAERRILKEPLNQSAAALSGSFVPAYRFENLEIHKVFLQFPNLNLKQNPSLTALAIESELP